MTTAEALYRANVFEAQAAYDRWLAQHVESETYKDVLITMATKRETWAALLRGKTGDAA